MKFRRLLPAVAVLLIAAVNAIGQPQSFPGWWLNGVLAFDPNNSPDNSAMVNIGQLKNIATLAKAHLDTKLGLTKSDWDNAYGGAANNPFPFSTTPDPDNHAPALVGQLKFLASGFYNILHAAGYNVVGRLNTMGASSSISGSGPYYPWTANTPTGENWSPVNVGQLKLAFSFDLDPPTDLSPDMLGTGYAPFLTPIAPANVNGGTGIKTVEDTVVNETIGSTIGSQFQLLNNPWGLPVSFTNVSSSDPNVATVTQDGKVLWTNGGVGGSTVISFTAMISYGTQFPISDSLPVTLTPSDPGYYTFISHPSDSLAQHCKSQLDAILPGYSTNPDYLSQTDRFTSAEAPPTDLNNTAQTQVILNPANLLVAHGIDTSCLPIPGSSDAGSDAGCAITPRHLLIAEHLHIPIDYTVYFLGTDHAIYSRYVTEEHDLGNDLMILTLNADLPSAVHPAAVMPVDAATHLPALYTKTSYWASAPGSLDVGNWVPCFSIQSRSGRHFISVRACFNDGTLDHINSKFIAPQGATGNYRNVSLEQSYYEDAIPGDSGHANFLIINSRLVVLCVFHTGDGAGAAPSVQHFHDAINAVLAADLPVGNYSLTDVNLSGFPSY